MQTAQNKIEDAFASQRLSANTVASDDTQALLAGLLEELLNSALLTATTASIANWMLTNQQSATRRNLSCYFPPSPSFFQQTILQLCVRGDTIAISSCLREYYDRLTFLRLLTLRYAECDGASADADPVSIEVLSGAWQELASAARVAVLELGEATGIDKSANSHPRYLRVVELLAEIQLGYHPCVKHGGVVNVPFWTERRTLQRKHINLQAFIVVGECIERVVVLNASDRGIGVLGLLNAPTGTLVQLLIRPGLSIGGKVVWVDQDRAGISLEQPLPANSSLFELIN